MKKILSFQNIIFAAIAVYLVFMLISQQKTLDENIDRGEDIRSELAVNRKMMTCGESQFWFDGIKERADLFRELYPNKAVNPL